MRAAKQPAKGGNIYLISDYRFWLAASLLVLTVIACSGSASRATPVGAPTTTGATVTPAATALPVTRMPVEPIVGEGVGTASDLTILGPVDGAILRSGAVRVMGVAAQDAVVAVNGAVVPVQVDGSFFSDLVLDDEIVDIEVTAVDLTGAAASFHLAVFNMPGSGGLSLDVIYPPDGLEVRSRSIEVAGVASADAVVAINGLPATQNALGIFTQRLDISDGVNLIEITAVNPIGESKTTQLAVFFAP